MKKWETRNLGTQTFDRETGEVLDDITLVAVGRRIRWRENYYMQFQDKLEEIAENPKFGWRTLRVMMLLMSKLGWENWLHINQTEIAKQLGLHRPDVNKAVKFLVDEGVILKGPKMGRCHAYKLNSNYAFKGKLTDLTAYRQKEKRHLSLVKDEGQDACEETMGLFEQ